MIPRLLRLIALATILAVLGPAALRSSVGPLAPLDALAPEAHATEREPKECICHGNDEGSSFGACQHWLRNPKSITADPCWCHKCRNFSQHDGGEVPEGMNNLCFGNKREGCYLKRHAVAWGITCSKCVQEECGCNTPNPQNCPDCGANSRGDPFERDAYGAPGRETVLKRLEAESRHFKKAGKLVVAYNRHFYLVTDVSGLKVKTEAGAPRIISTHEWVHLTIERAEYARREFTDHFGSRLLITRPTGMYFPKKERDAQRIQGAYLGSAKTNLLYGGGVRGGGVADGFCFHGFCSSEQKFGGDDGLHMVMRHLLGHEFISCWEVVDGNNRALPRWLFVGAAHWLCKLQERFRDEVTFCGNESTPLSASGKGWEGDCAKIAAAGKFDPVEEMFGKTAGGQLTVKDHKRAWGYLHIALKEWREPFVKVLADIRRQKEIRDTFMANLNCTPEVFDERWQERVSGRRKHLSPEFDEDEFEGNETPGARERRALLRETDVAALAARVRALGTVTEIETIQVLLDLLAKNSELVRETIMVTLLKTRDPEVLEAMWQVGLAHKHAMTRAYTARACGKLKLEWALPLLRTQLEDTNWYARAEAAVACGILQDIESMKGLRTMVDDPAEKARVAAMDALAMFGEDANLAVPLIAPHLKAGAWQLRIAACQSLGAIGSMEAVDPLIDRMEIESGRIRREIQEALKLITRDDLGRNPKYWREWWDKLKVNTPTGLPKRPDEPPPKKDKDKPDPDARYAKQIYYGIEIFSSRIGFVLDTSGSMNSNFLPDASTTRKLSREYAGTNKITICKEEIAQSLDTLDPRAHFNIYSFNTRVRSWKKNPVQASTGNKKSAVGFLKSLPATGETNYYQALRMALDLGDEQDASPNFRSTPDTLTFLTDGAPTRGEITNADVLLEWYTSMNRYARITTHVICFGTKGVDLVLLRGMAERNWGRFILVKERD